MSHHNHLRTSFFMTFFLAAFSFGCGGSVTPAEDQENGSPETGGTGGSSENGQVSCSNLAGTVELEDIDDRHPGVRIWIHENSEGACRAVVSSPGFEGYEYIVTVSPSAAVLTPQKHPATSGKNATSEVYRTVWNEITLDVVGGKLGTSATAKITKHFSQQGDTVPQQDSVQVPIVPAKPTTLEAEKTIFPWESVTVFASSPVTSIADHLVFPNDQWHATDISYENDGTVGIIQSELQFLGPWNDMQGSSIPIDILPSLIEVSGTPVATSSVSVHVEKIGPAVKEHSMPDTGTLLTWGWVDDYTEGECAALGCVAIRSACNFESGLAGQIMTKGASKVVLSMRLEPGYNGSMVKPAMERVLVIAPDGSLLSSDKQENWDEDHEPQVWTYDTKNYDVVGFMIEKRMDCWGSGGPIILESVRAE